MDERHDQKVQQCRPEPLGDAIISHAGVSVGRVVKEGHAENLLGSMISGILSEGGN